MKSYSTLAAIMLVILIIMMGCETDKKKDSSEIAKEQNKAVIDDKDDEKDADFVVNAVAANIAEVKLAELALDKSSDDEVKKMARMLEGDHTKVLQSLKGYAATKGISIPTSETEDALKERNELAEKSGKDFDDKWCEKLKDSHQKSIRKFESRLDKTEDVGLKNLLSSTLPDLRNHLEMLKKHDDTMK